MGHDASSAWRTQGELWLARGLKQFYSACSARLPQYQHPVAQRHAWGPAEPNVASIPRIIWAYWNGSALPEVVARCVAGWRALHPGWRIEVLDDVRARAVTSHWPDALDQVTVQRRSDWLRLELLRQHGGIWLDASTILTRPLDWVGQEQQQARSDFVGFYLDRFTRLPRYPVVESWFMAAPPGSRFIIDAQQEFTREVIEGDAQTYLDKLKAQGLLADAVQGIDSPLYLTIHVAMQRTLQRQGAAYRLSLWRAEDTAFTYHVQARWNRAGLKKRLFMMPLQGPPAPLIKLRGPDRKKLDLYLQQNIMVPGSLAQQYLPAGAPTASEDLP